MSDEICPICGGKKRIAYTIVLQECVPHEIRVEPHQEGFLCPGHRAAKQHDGSLDTLPREDENHAFVEFQEIVGIEHEHAVLVIFCSRGAKDSVVFSLEQAESLRDWLVQETPTIRDLIQTRKQDSEP